MNQFENWKLEIENLKTMAIIRWGDVDRFFDDDWGLVPMMRNAAKFRMPAVDVYQNESEVVAEVEIPAGIDPEKVDISVEGDMLHIKGENESQHEEKEKDYYRREIRRGSFERSVALPTMVKGQEARAEFEKGVLKVVIPKAEEAKVNKVRVEVKK